MAMYFRYQPVRMGRVIHPLGGRTVRPRPLVDVTLIGPADSRVRQAILDSGADDTIFPESLAPILGIDLSNAPAGTAGIAGAGVISLRYAAVLVRMTDGLEQREWPAIIGFTPAKLVYPSLGFAGVLQFFTTTFHGDREEVQLSINALYPGT